MSRYGRRRKKPIGPVRFKILRRLGLVASPGQGWQK